MTGLPLTLLAPGLLAVLLVASALVKLRAGERAGLGLHLPSLLELLSAVCIGLLVVSGSMTPRIGLWAALVTGTLVVGSSIHLSRRLAHQRRIRELTEGRRLETFVRYLSDGDS